MDRLAHSLFCWVRGLLKLLPVPVIVALGRAAGSVTSIFAGPYRALAWRNLEIAFGRTKSPAERRRLLRQHFAWLGGNLLASIRFTVTPKEQLLDHIDIDGIEQVRELLQRGGVLMAISHLGNWEAMAQLMPAMFENTPLGVIYQRLGNPYMDAEVREARARLGVQVFERKEGFNGALQVLRQHGVVGVLIDQHAGDAGVWCPFFDRLASTSPLAAMLALRTGAAIVTGAVETNGCGRWRMKFNAPLTPCSRNPDEVTAQINLALQRQIEAQPADWFWVHNRWKTPQPKFLLETYKRGIVSAPREAGSEAEQKLQPFSVVIRTPNWLGDAVMSVPAVEAIKRGRPDLRLTVLTPAKLADFWQQVAAVDEVIAVPAKESVFKTARRLKGKFDAAILFPNSLRTALEVWLAGIPRRVGYPGHSRRRLLNQPFEEKKKKGRPPEHQVFHYLRLAEFVGAEIPPLPKFPPAPRRHRIAGPLRIAVCPGAEYGPAKRWLPERFREVMTRFKAERPTDWIMIGASKDVPAGEEVARGFAGNLQNVIGKTTLKELIDLLRGCDLLLTNDTGTMHLAAWLGVPLVAVFGSTEDMLTGPWSENSRVVRKHVPCSPCFLRKCPIDFRCMKSVEADQVLEKMRELLG